MAQTMQVRRFKEGVCECSGTAREMSSSSTAARKAQQQGKHRSKAAAARRQQQGSSSGSEAAAATRQHAQVQSLSWVPVLRGSVKKVIAANGVLPPVALCRHPNVATRRTEPSAQDAR